MRERVCVRARVFLCMCARGAAPARRGAARAGVPDCRRLGAGAVDSSASVDEMKPDVAVMGAWDFDNSHAVLGKYHITSSDVSCVYWRAVKERVQVSADITLHGADRTAELGGGYRVVLRREPGGFDYTTLRGQVKHSGHVLVGVDHMLLQGGGIASMNLSMKHGTPREQEYLIGVQLRLFN